MSGTATQTARPLSPAARRDREEGVTLQDLTQGWTITKRDGRVVPFDHKKIDNVLWKCLYLGMGMDGEQAEPIIRRLTTRVVNLLDAQGKTSPTVEEVQQAVIHQLWADGRYEAAEHYTLYREERRKAREERPVDPAVAEMIAIDAAHFPEQIQTFQLYSKFSRWSEKNKRRETWREVNDRVFDWFGTLPAYARLREDEVGWLREMMYELKASPAMRVVQMAGAPLERCHVGVYNCAFHPICDLFSFAELLYILMQGTGAGFSVEYDYVGNLPRVRKQKKDKAPHKHQIPDTTEGWCDALLFGLQRWFSGEDVEFDYSLIRKKGSRLKTKGGQASGPEPLKEMLDFVRGVVIGAEGRHLTDLEVHDVCCMIGRIVQVGGVRRAACISLSDLNSVSMRECKHGAWWKAAKQRSMANNSAVYDEYPSVEVFLAEMTALVKSKSGERGIFNREAAQKCRPARRKKWKFGCNPCAEIILRPFQFCNLTISIVRGHETREELAEKVRAATYFGVLQSTATNFGYLRKKWKENCEEERLLGVDMMGHLDHPMLKPGAPGREELVQYLKGVVAETAQELSKRFGINYSAANTCLKPGGDSGVFFDTCSLGGYWSRYMIRRVREQKQSPVAALMRDQGVPYEDDPVNQELQCFAFPLDNGEGCVTHDDETAIQQLENWLFWKKNWAEHSCSVTISVKPHEWPAVIEWCYRPENFIHLTGVSFLPHDGGTYKAMPKEKITKEKYDEMMESFPKLDWSKLSRYEADDQTSGSQTFACQGDKCEM
jgi:ribonucleoside-triphosphate reductase (thioredoxin)